MRLDPHAKLLWHGNRVGRWLKTGRANPILVEIAPTGYCNADCPWCFFKDKYDSAIIHTGTMLRVIKELAIAGIRAINWTGGGEPTLHPDLGTFIQYAHRKGIKQGIFTNAFKEIPEQDKLEWVRISLTDRGYSVINKPNISFGICINQTEKYTPEDLRFMCLEAKKFGAIYFQIRPALIGSWNIQPYLEEPEYLKEYSSIDFNVYTTTYKYKEATRKRDYGLCYGYHFCPSVDWKGMLGVCLYMMHDKRFILGDLNKNHFLEIWQGIPGHIKVLPECQNCCKNHEINRLLFAAKNIRQIDFL